MFYPILELYNQDHYTIIIACTLYCTVVPIVGIDWNAPKQTPQPAAGDGF